MRIMDKICIILVLGFYSIANVVLDQSDTSLMVSALGIITAIGFALVKTNRGNESN